MGCEADRLAQIRSPPPPNRNPPLSDSRAMPSVGIDSLAMATDIEILVGLLDHEYYLQGGDDPQTDAASREQAAHHYLNSEWFTAADPTSWFSNRFYLVTNPDVAEAGINPLVHYVRHGRHEGRWPLPHLEALRFRFEPEQLPNEVAEDARVLSRRHFLKKYSDGFTLEQPLVTAIVPNYNHARFLDERFASILEQTYNNVEVVILDDCSTDGSRELINSYVARLGGENFRYVPNDRNSGNVFRQWRKGVELAKGDLIWICESDDTAERDFLEELVPTFTDLAVQIGFGRTQFVDENGYEMRGLDSHRESTEPGAWKQARSQPAASWFARPFSIKNIIPNVGGCIIRNQTVAEDVWAEASQYSVLGDWYLYLVLSRGGKIAYRPEAVSYFRQHGDNTSTNSFDRPDYYREHAMLATEIRRRWPVSADTSWQFYSQLLRQYTRHHPTAPEAELANHLSFDSLMKTEREDLHILIGFNGFQVGGGEYYPLHLANALRELGVQVSMLALDLNDRSPEMLDQLDTRIPVYSPVDVRATGPDKFVKAAGIDLIHSHHLGVEMLFHASDDEAQTLRTEPQIPYVASLHGTYEVTDLNEHWISRASSGVTHWVHTTDKNLGHHLTRRWLQGEITKMPNAMPVDNRPWHTTRTELGIGEQDFVFALIARAIPEKGWQDAIEAIVSLRDENSAGHDIHLLLVGDGDYQKELAERWTEHPAVHFVGFQANIHGILRLSDCCLLPTRFVGESFPLILIQAIQAETPSIATDAGEIRSMLSGPNWQAGLVVKWHDDDAAYVDELKAAMRQVQQPEIYRRLVDGARAQAPSYDITQNAKRYLELYEREISRLSTRGTVVDLSEGDGTKDRSPSPATSNR